MSRWQSHTRTLDALGIFAIALAGRLAYWLVAGTRVVGDATDAVDFCQNVSLSALVGFKHTIVYSGFQLPYCGYLFLSGGYIDGWVIIQILLSAASCVLLYETGRLLIGRTAGLIAGLSFALVWEVFHWVVRPMSEPVFTIVAVVALWRLAVYETEPTRRNRALAVGTLLYLAITRPNGLPIVAGYVLWDTLFASNERRLNLFFRRPINLVLVSVFGALALYRLFKGGAFLPIERLARGFVVTGHVYYDFPPVATDSTLSFLLFNIHHIVLMMVLRGLWFFAPVLPGWSLPHIALSMVTLFPVTVGGLVGTYRAYRTDMRLFKLWVTPILMIVITAMVMWVAGSRNFLGPAVASYCLLAGYAVQEPLDRLLTRFRAAV